MSEQWPFKPFVEGSNPSPPTISGGLMTQYGIWVGPESSTLKENPIAPRDEWIVDGENLVKVFHAETFEEASKIYDEYIENYDEESR